MARIDTLSNFLTDVADSIREKKGTTEKISAANFDTEIESLPSGGGSADDYFDLTKKNSGTAAVYIKTIPQIDTSNYTNIGSMFNGFEGLTSIPLLDTSKATYMDYMFSNCKNLTSIPLLDTSKVENMNFVFVSCYELKSIPLLNTSNVVGMKYIFSGCHALTSIPEIDISNVTNMSNAFNNCYLLEEIPSLNTSKLVDMGAIFSNCYQLKTVPLLDTAKVKTISAAFSNCEKLENLGGLENLGQAYSTSDSANKFAYRLDLSSSVNLTHDSLMNIINNLYDIATAGVAQQQLVLGATNLAKLTADEIAVGTSKGWALS